MRLTIATAKLQHVPALVALINGAYRGDASRLGWTTEADLLAGRRTDVANVSQLLTATDSVMLMALEKTELLGCIHLQRQSMNVQLGMLAVLPTRQGQGIGKQLLTAAEAEARQRWATKQLIMAVIPLRTELIAFYQRCGYQANGQISEFPQNPALWTPKVAGLCLTWLEKNLN